MRNRAFALTTAMAVFFVTSASLARGFAPGGAHVNYGLGGATGQLGGFRHNLDLALFPLLVVLEKGSYIETKSGLTAGASTVMGIGSSPSYATLEVGPGFSSFAGGVATLGPAWRMREGKHKEGTGGQFRLSVDFFLVEVGFRVIKIFSDEGETQATFTVGIGRF